MPWIDALDRCPGSMSWIDVLDRCPGSMPWIDALDRYHDINTIQPQGKGAGVGDRPRTAIWR